MNSKLSLDPVADMAERRCLLWAVLPLPWVPQLGWAGVRRELQRPVLLCWAVCGWNGLAATSK